jgi:hypothetical protein
VPAKLGICSNTCGAGKPVERSSKVHDWNTRLTGNRSVPTTNSSGTGSLERASMRTRKR